MTTTRSALAVVVIAGDGLAVDWWLPTTPTPMANAKATASARRRAVLRMWTVKWMGSFAVAK
ncbi:MAG: hypothetical protein IPM30_14880 [Burkholderiales bacterium]|nr:hypothetical protein [Burkholderiales bacterium]